MNESYDFCDANDGSNTPAAKFPGKLSSLIKALLYFATGCFLAIALSQSTPASSGNSKAIVYVNGQAVSGGTKTGDAITAWGIRILSVFLTVFPIWLGSLYIADMVFPLRGRVGGLRESAIKFSDRAFFISPKATEMNDRSKIKKFKITACIVLVAAFYLSSFGMAFLRMQLRGVYN